MKKYNGPDRRQQPTGIKYLFLGPSKAGIMRICVFATVISACYCAIAGVEYNRDLTGLGVLVGAMLAAAFGGTALGAGAKKPEDNNVAKN